MISDRLQAFIIYASSHGLMDDHESPVQPYVRDWELHVAVVQSLQLLGTDSELQS